MKQTTAPDTPRERTYAVVAAHSFLGRRVASDSAGRPPGEETLAEFLNKKQEEVVHELRLDWNAYVESFRQELRWVRDHLSVEPGVADESSRDDSEDSKETAKALQSFKEAAALALQETIGAPLRAMGTANASAIVRHSGGATTPTPSLPARQAVQRRGSWSLSRWRAPRRVGALVAVVGLAVCAVMATWLGTCHDGSDSASTASTTPGERSPGLWQQRSSRPSAQGAVKVSITQVPPAGPGGPKQMKRIAGVVKPPPRDARVVIYARTDLFYVQPFEIRPFTEIQADGSWSTHTHLGLEYAALVVRAGYSPPIKTAVLPSIGGDVLASTVVPGRE